MREILADRIKKETEKTKKRYEKKFGMAIFDIGIKKISRDLFVLEGNVLIERQKKEISDIVNDIIAKNGVKINSENALILSDSVKKNVRVLSDPRNKMEIGWGVVLIKVADLWSVFFGKKSVPAGSKDKYRVTQAIKNEILRILFEKGDWYLVQTKDLAIGWVKRSEMVKAKTGKKWKREKIISAGQIIKIKKSANVGKKFTVFLEKYFAAPYLLGGKTEKGIDCSGLVQEFYLALFGVLLPRHSVDQASCGKKIDPSRFRFGDLIFLRHKKNKRAHIGIIIEEGRDLYDTLILNSRKESGGVTVQSFFEILEIYDFFDARRIISAI